MTIWIALKKSNLFVLILRRALRWKLRMSRRGSALFCTTDACGVNQPGAWGLTLTSSKIITLLKFHSQILWRASLIVEQKRLFERLLGDSILYFKLNFNEYRLYCIVSSGWAQLRCNRPPKRRYFFFNAASFYQWLRKLNRQFDSIMMCYERLFLIVKILLRTQSYSLI